MFLIIYETKCLKCVYGVCKAANIELLLIECVIVCRLFEFCKERARKEYAERNGKKISNPSRHSNDHNRHIVTLNERIPNII